MELDALIFRTLQGEKIISDIPSYLNGKIQETTKVLIGCDSQTMGGITSYGLVVVLHYGNRGGHVLYTQLDLPVVKDRFTKLWKEVEYSIDLAEALMKAGLTRIDYIDVDLASDVKWNSNTILRSAMGWVTDMGYNARCKPDAICASYVADKVCRKSKFKKDRKKFKKRKKELV